MNEEEWLTAAEPWEMLTFVRSASGRKLRLFTCACCRQVLNSFVPPLVLRAVGAAEAFADGGITAATLAEVNKAVGRALAGATDYADLGTGYLRHLSDAVEGACEPGDEARAAGKAALAAARAAGDVPWPATGEFHRGWPDELAAQAEVLRELFGNPFRKVEFDPTWRTSDVIALARSIYDRRAFAAMPILADALQEAGCDDEEMLAHCRDANQVHVRGCWVVDLVLG